MKNGGKKNKEKKKRHLSYVLMRTFSDFDSRRALSRSTRDVYISVTDMPLLIALIVAAVGASFAIALSIAVAPIGREDEDEDEDDEDDEEDELEAAALPSFEPEPRPSLP